ncbi:MAG TPA: DUF6122 family protein [Flavobacteriaceae bacterium]|nr:DUF6122 family protein [Flavobacteriaceae bacterium]
MLQNIVHYFLHFGFPLVLALLFYRSKWRRVYWILLLTMLVDIDHLWADPIFDPTRCSIGYHTFHSYYMMPIYVLGLFFRKTRVVAIGLVLHMITDGVDCIWMHNNT